MATKKDLPLAAIKAAATRLVADTDHGLGSICPVTGLFTPSALPSLPGMVMEAHHALCFNALALLSHSSYCAALEPSLKAGLVLAAFNAVGKLELTGSAYTINQAMALTLTVAQLDTLLAFITDSLLTTSKHYPKLKLAAGRVDERTFLSYMAVCVDVENTRIIMEPTGQAKSVPKFLSSPAKGKALDADCYEAWLELAPFLPKALVAKAKPYIRTLATILDSTLVGKLVARCAAEIDEDGLVSVADSGLLEYSEFARIVEESRKKAAALGLHRSELDDLDLFSTPASGPTAPEQAEPTTTIAAAAPSLSFSERMALKKAGLL